MVHQPIISWRSRLWFHQPIISWRLANSIMVLHHGKTVVPLANSIMVLHHGGESIYTHLHSCPGVPLANNIMVLHHGVGAQLVWKGLLQLNTCLDWLNLTSNLEPVTQSQTCHPVSIDYKTCTLHGYKFYNIPPN